MSLIVTGLSTTIVQQLEEIADEKASRIDCDLAAFGCSFGFPPGDPKHHRYVLAAGYLPGKSIEDATAEQLQAAWLINFVNTARLVNAITARDPFARICVVGSMSAVLGSYDEAYAASKRALHDWCERRPAKPGQQLVVVAPPIIIDSGMTRARPDFAAVRQTRVWVTAADVARVIHGLLWSAQHRSGTGVYRVAPTPWADYHQ
jgi:NAD(P)-dependent dehydrogenase (short-subunit alcohol dehydrogenase family)